MRRVSPDPRPAAVEHARRRARTRALARSGHPSSAITRQQATSKAGAALGAGEAAGPVVVFALPEPLRPGSRITQGRGRKLVLAVGRERALFFYRDGSPSQPEAEDELLFKEQNGIVGEYDDTTGVLTLRGEASVADYEAALRSVYENWSKEPSERVVTFQADDGAGYNNLSEPVTRGIAIVPDW